MTNHCYRRCHRRADVAENERSLHGSTSTPSAQRSCNIISNGTMHRLITALLLAASQAAVIKPAALLLAATHTRAAIIRPGDKYTLDPSRDQCTTIIVGKDATGDGGRRQGVGRLRGQIP